MNADKKSSARAAKPTAEDTAASAPDPRRAPSGPAKTLGEAAYTLLRRQILSGGLEPGQKLQFRVLVKNYGYGIAPLREALSKLATERLVLFEGQRGFTVAPVSRKELHEVCSVWSELSAAALSLSLKLGDADWEAHVLACAHRLSRAPLPSFPEDYDTIETWEKLHSAFHMSLVQGCDSPWREHLCAVLCDQFERYRRIVLLKMAVARDIAGRIDAEHREIAEAAVRRDPAAVELLKTHFDNSLAFLDAHFSQEPGLRAAGTRKRA